MLQHTGGVPLPQSLQRHALVEKRLQIIQPQHGGCRTADQTLTGVEQRSQRAAIARSDQLQLGGPPGPPQRLVQGAGFPNLRTPDHHHQPAAATQRRGHRILQRAVDVTVNVPGDRVTGQNGLGGGIDTDPRRIDLGNRADRDQQPTI
jgi:hypothetical protein